MFITIKYFGQIAEVTKKDEEQIEAPVSVISDLLKILNTKYSDLRNKNFQVAQNQELVSLDTKLSGEEIALLPPFSGG